ncbi:MAG: hypothetical protein ABSE49_24920 [Polyangiaceae bacterium]
MRFPGSVVILLFLAVLGAVACGARSELDVNPPDADTAPDSSDATSVFTYLVAQGAEGTTPTSLVAIDGSGDPISTTPLGDPADYALWSRLVFDDGSFLLNAFREDSTTGVYSGVLEHFDAQGNTLSPSVAQPANAAPLMLAVTPGGALASWWTEISAAAFAPLDPSGGEAGSVTTVPFTAAPYGEALAATPSGDVLVTLLEDAVEMNDTWTIYIQEHAPDGTPRGPLVALPSPIGGFDPSDVHTRRRSGRPSRARHLRERRGPHGSAGVRGLGAKSRRIETVALGSPRHGPNVPLLRDRAGG